MKNQATTRHTTTIIELDDITVPESATVEALIRLGTYANISPHINSQNFPVTRYGPCKPFLAWFPMSMKTAEVREEVAAMDNKELAHIGELLVVGTHPGYMQVVKSIACLGSSAVVNGECFVPCLFRCETEWDLSIGYHDKPWHNQWLFLLTEKRRYVPTPRI